MGGGLSVNSSLRILFEALDGERKGLKLIFNCLVAIVDDDASLADKMECFHVLGGGRGKK